MAKSKPATPSPSSQVNVELKLEPTPVESEPILPQKKLKNNKQKEAERKKPKEDNSEKPKQIKPKKSLTTPVDLSPKVSQQTWVIYNSENIVNTHFVPLIGEARKFYPKLEFCDTGVRLTSIINGKSACFTNNSVTTTARKDFEFLPVLLEWRQAYICALLNLTAEQFNAQSRIDEDILSLHKSIKAFYCSSAATDPVVIKNHAEELIKQTLNYCDKCTTDIDVFVRLQRLHLKIDVFLVIGANKFQKLIDVILD